jgi:hypothetical protein
MGDSGDVMLDSKTTTPEKARDSRHLEGEAGGRRDGVREDRQIAVKHLQTRQASARHANRHADKDTSGINRHTQSRQIRRS